MNHLFLFLHLETFWFLLFITSFFGVFLWDIQSWYLQNLSLYGGMSLNGLGTMSLWFLVPCILEVCYFRFMYFIISFEKCLHLLGLMSDTIISLLRWEGEYFFSTFSMLPFFSWDAFHVNASVFSAFFTFIWVVLLRLCMNSKITVFFLLIFRSFSCGHSSMIVWQPSRFSLFLQSFRMSSGKNVLQLDYFFF